MTTATITLPEDADRGANLVIRSNLTGRDSAARSLKPGEQLSATFTDTEHVVVMPATISGATAETGDLGDPEPIKTPSAPAAGSHVNF